MEGTIAKRRSHWPLAILSTCAALFSMILPLVLVRILTPHEVGIFKIFFLYLTIIPAFALTSGIMSSLAFWAGRGKEGIKPIQTSSILIVLLAITFVVAVFIFRPTIEHALGLNEQQSLLFAFALLGAIAAPFFEEVAISTGKIWTGAIFYSGFEFIRAFAILFAIFFYRSLTAVLLAHTLIITFKVLCGYLYSYKLQLTGAKFDRQSLRTVWSYAFPVSLAWVFGIFISSADQFILSTYISPAQFAIYSIGCLAIAPLLIFEHSITRVLIPQMSEAFSHSQNNRAALLYQSAVENLSFFLIPAVVGLVIFATPIIQLFFTNQYSAAAPYLQLYAFTYIFLIIPYDALPRARGQSGWILRTFIIFSIFSLGMAGLLTHFWGPFGALSALLLTGAAMRTYAIVYFKKQIELPLNRFLPLESFVRYTLLCLVLGGCALAARPYFTNSHIWFFVCGSAFALLYLLIALPSKNRSERLRHPSPGVLIIAQSLDIGGIERMILHLSEYLQEEKKWAIHVLAYDHTNKNSQDLLSKFASRNIPVETFKKAKGFSPLAVVRIVRNIYRNDIYIIHTQDLGGLIYAALAKLCCFGRIKIVHTQHSFIHLERKARYGVYEKLLTRFVDKLSVVSEDTKKTYLKLGVDSEKISLIQNGVVFSTTPLLTRTERISQRPLALEHIDSSKSKRLSAHMQDYWIVYLARLFPGKGQEHAVALWNKLKPEIRYSSILCFIGPESAAGQYQQLENIIEKSQDNERIFILGETQEPHSWLNASDLYLSCSEFEGMPLGPLEAVGSGVPTLLSNIPGHDFLKDVTVQYPFADYKRGANEMEKILNKIATDGLNYFQEAWNNGRHLREHFSVEEMSRKYSLLYAENMIPSRNSFAIRGEALG